MVPEYDISRATYALTQRSDPSIAAAIERALGDSRAVASVGTYESPDRELIALEPPAGADARLPLDDDSADAALAVMTTQHWRDQNHAARELRRVARERVVIFTYDAERAESLWLVRDYLPELAALERQRFLPIRELAGTLGARVSIERVPIPHDCRDGLLGAFWRRPERYLDANNVPADSALAALDPDLLARARAKLRNDLDSGAWRRLYGGLLARERLDVGYRLVIAEL